MKPFLIFLFCAVNVCSNTFAHNSPESNPMSQFPLGRSFMMGVDFGTGIFTLGLGRSADPGILAGARLIYFFNPHIGPIRWLK